MWYMSDVTSMEIDSLHTRSQRSELLDRDRIWLTFSGTKSGLKYKFWERELIDLDPTVSICCTHRTCLHMCMIYIVHFRLNLHRFAFRYYPKCLIPTETFIIHINSYSSFCLSNVELCLYLLPSTKVSPISLWMVDLIKIVKIWDLLYVYFSIFSNFGKVIYGTLIIYLYKNLSQIK